MRDQLFITLGLRGQVAHADSTGFRCPAADGCSAYKCYLGTISSGRFAPDVCCAPVQVR